MSFFLSSVLQLVNKCCVYDRLIEAVEEEVRKHEIPFLTVDWTWWHRLEEGDAMVPIASLGDRSAVRFLRFISIDRGVDDWIVFKTILDAFPALEVLIFDQNYSTSSDDAFLEFLRTTRVRLIIFRDFQTECTGPKLLHEWCPDALAVSGATLVILQEYQPETDYCPENGCAVCDKNDISALCCQDQKLTVCLEEHSDHEIFTAHIIDGAGCLFCVSTMNMHVLVAEEDRRAEHLFSRTYADQLLVQRRFHWSRLKPQLIEWAIGLQDLELPALVTQTIFEQSCEDADLVPMIDSWNVITCIKHFLSNKK